MMSGAFSLVNVLADSLGPGTIGLDGQPQDFFMASAGLCLVCFYVQSVYLSVCLSVSWGTSVLVCFYVCLKPQDFFMAPAGLCLVS